MALRYLHDFNLSAASKTMRGLLQWLGSWHSHWEISADQFGGNFSAYACLCALCTNESMGSFAEPVAETPLGSPISRFGAAGIMGGA